MNKVLLMSALLGTVLTVGCDNSKSSSPNNEGSDVTTKILAPADDVSGLNLTACSAKHTNTVDPDGNTVHHLVAHIEVANNGTKTITAFRVAFVNYDAFDNPVGDGTNTYPGEALTTTGEIDAGDTGTNSYTFDNIPSNLAKVTCQVTTVS
jgi:hypothetical protein